MGTISTKESIASVLFGKTRRALLSVLYGHPDEQYYLMQLVRAADVGKGAVQRELKQLTDSGIIKREQIGRQIFYQANEKCPVFDELRMMVVKTIGYADVLKDAFDDLKKHIKIAFIYGSVATADESRRSDVDVMIIGDISLGKAVTTLRKAEDILKREINPSVYPVKEFVSKIKEGHHFLNRVLEGPKIFLIGDEDELSRMVG